MARDNRKLYLNVHSDFVVIESWDVAREKLERSFSILLYDVNNLKWQRNQNMRKRISLYKAPSRRF